MGMTDEGVMRFVLLGPHKVGNSCKDKMVSHQREAGIVFFPPCLCQILCIKYNLYGDGWVLLLQLSCLDYLVNGGV